MITKEATDNRAHEYCQNLIESLQSVNIQDIDFFKSQILEEMLLTYKNDEDFI